MSLEKLAKEVLGYDEADAKIFAGNFIKKASEVFKTSEEIEAFGEGILKKAAGPEPGFWINVAKGAGGALGAAGVGLALGALSGRVGGVFDSVERNQMHVKFQAALNQVKQNNRIVKASDQAKVNSYAETIFKFAPHVAGDPNVLGSLLANIIQGDSIDPMTIKMLVELEGRYKDNAKPAYIS